MILSSKNLHFLSATSIFGEIPESWHSIKAIRLSGGILKPIFGSSLPIIPIDLRFASNSIVITEAHIRYIK